MNNEVADVIEVKDSHEQTETPAQLVESNDIDWHLANLVALTNDYPGVGIGVTLTVNGALVSGLLISGKEYFDSLSEEIGKDSGNSLSMGISEGMKNISETLYSSSSKPRPVNTVYIHLKDARHYIGGSAIPQKGAYWRGKLCDVSGFTFGSLSQD